MKISVRFCRIRRPYKGGAMQISVRLRIRPRHRVNGVPVRVVQGGIRARGRSLKLSNRSGICKHQLAQTNLILEILKLNFNFNISA